MYVVCLSVCDVGGSWPHRLKILKTNFANNQPNIVTLRSPKVIHLLPGERGEILGRKCSFNTYVHNVRLNWIESTESYVILSGGVAVCIFTFVGASRGHLCDRSAFLSFDLQKRQDSFDLLLVCTRLYTTNPTRSERAFEESNFWPIRHFLHLT